MSWLRSAVNKAVEVGGRNNATRRVRNLADAVVLHAGQAVTGGARIIQDRMVSRNYKSYKQTMKQLEELAVSCRGVERVQLLKRWLTALKEIEQLSRNPQDDGDQGPVSPNDSTLSPNNASMSKQILFYDSDMGGEPLNFRDAFLHSQALEGITLSMILEAPNEEEGSLLHEFFGLCFTGGKELHHAIVDNIRELANAFSGYEDEVLVKREELLQYAQCAISGLKLNPDLDRIDTETSSLWKYINAMEESQISSTNNNESIPEVTTLGTPEALEDALAEVRMCSRLESLLIKKKFLNNGDSQETHSQKVNKLKVLTESLANSSSKAETRILDQRRQTEEACNFRVAKTKDVSVMEKELLMEISELEKQKDGLEDQLRKVQSSLMAALTRLNKTREEKGQFEEASNHIVLHLKSKEDELSRSVASCKVEADTVFAWIKFLEDAWSIQSSHTDQKEKQVMDELEKYGDCSMKLIKLRLSSCKEELGSSIHCLKTIVDNFKIFNHRPGTTQHTDNEIPTESNPRRLLEEEYIKNEKKVIGAFNLVDHMRELYYAEQDRSYRKETPETKALFEAMEELRLEFGSIQRPQMEIEAGHASYAPMSDAVGPPAVSAAAVAVVSLEAESRDGSRDDIGDWEFDDGLEPEVGAVHAEPAAGIK